VDKATDRTEHSAERTGDEDAKQRTLIGIRRKHYRPEESGAEADSSNDQRTLEYGPDNPRKHR
jgi:hypothetical protein